MSGFVSTLVKFLAFLFVLLLGIWIAIPFILEPKLEDLASQTHGAQVDIGDLSLGLFPFGVEFEGIEVTDKKEPELNTVQIQSVVFELEFLPLLAGNVIVPEAGVSGVDFKQKRSTPGFVLEKVEAKEESKVGNPLSDYFENLQALGDLENFDAAALLEKEPLKSIELANDLENKLSESKKKIEALNEKIPDKEQLKALEEKVKAITKGKIKSLEDVQKSKQELEQVFAEVKSLRATVKEAKETVSESVSTLKDGYGEMTSLAGADLEYLKNKYSLDVSGLSNVASLLFEEAAGEWVHNIYQAYELVQPFLGDLSSAETANIEEPEEVVEDEDTTTPDFLIRTLNVTDIQQQDINFGFVASNITHQQDRVGLPLTLAVDALGKDGKLSVDGVIDRLKGVAKDQLTWDIGNWPMPMIDLGMDGAQIDTSKLLTTGGLTREGTKLLGSFEGALKDMVYASSGDSAGGKLGIELVSAMLATLKEIDFSGNIAGTDNNPEWSLRSSLDKHFKEALTSQITEQNSFVNDAINKAIKDKLAGADGAYKDYAKYLEGTNVNLGSVDESLEDLLDAKVDAYKDQAKEKLKESLNKKLKGLF